MLFTLSKEKLNTSWKYAMAVIILDFLQVGRLLPSIQETGAEQAQSRQGLLSTHTANTISATCSSVRCSSACSTCPHGFPGHSIRTSGESALQLHISSILMQAGLSQSNDPMIQCRVYRVYEYSQLQRLALAGGQTVFYIFQSLFAVIVVFSGCLCLFVAQVKQRF